MWESMIISTIYTSVASSMVLTACVVHSLGPLSRNSSAKIPELSTSWWSILWTVWINPLVDHRGFPFWAAINWSRSALRTPVVHYVVSWRQHTSVWSNSHLIAYCISFSLLLVSCTIFKYGSLVICLVAALAASQWTNGCLRCCCPSANGKLDEAWVIRLDWDPLPTGWGVCGALTCCCGKGEEDDKEKKWGVLKNI